MRFLPTVLAVIGTLTFSEMVFAQGWHNFFDAVHQSARAMHRHQPEVPGSPIVEHTADEIDYLEHLIETYGSVVPKQPDIWGEARLTKHRHEYELELAKRFSEERFTAGIQGAVRRSDEAFLAASLALSNAAGGDGDDDDDTNSEVKLELEPGAFASDTIGEVDLSRFAPEGEQNLSLEPVIEAAQLSRYLNYLNELRRINEGDDTADAPGYALNLVRIPVSVLPGKETRKGYGAEITFTVDPYITDELMPTTIESLIINDIVSEFAVPLARFFNNDPIFAEFVVVHWQAVNDRSQNWMTIYDRYVEYLNSTHHKDLSKYMLDNRSYIEERLMGLAALDEFLRLRTEGKLPEGLPMELADKISDGFSFRRGDAEFNGSLRQLAQTFDSLADAARGVSSNLKDKLHGQDKFQQQVVNRKQTLTLSIPKRGLVDFLVAGIRAHASEDQIRPAFVTELRALAERELPEIVVFEVDYSLQEASTFRSEFNDWVADSRLPVPFPVRIRPDLPGIFAKASVNNCVQRLQQTDATQSVEAIQNKCADELMCELNEINTQSSFEEILIGVMVKAISKMQNVATREDSESNEKNASDPSLPQQEITDSQQAITEIYPAFPDLPAKARDVINSFVDEFKPQYEHYIEKAFEYEGEVSLTLDSLGANLPSELIDISSSVPVRSQTSQRAVPPSQFSLVYGYHYMGILSTHAFSVLRAQPANHPIIHEFDIRQYLKEELKAAYNYLRCPGNAPLWRPVYNGELNRAIRCGDYGLLSRLRTAYLEEVRKQGAAPGPAPSISGTVTEALAWAILTHAALVNQQLVEDMQAVSQSKGCMLPIPEHVCFVVPKQHLGQLHNSLNSPGSVEELIPPGHASHALASAEVSTEQFSAEAEVMEQQRQEAFQAYVRCKWPIYVFNLDPITDDQNIADVFSRRRELQLAAAIAVANGEMSGSSAYRFTRTLETDIETIALNRTAVGFTHGQNTFGWRFYPRVQTPDTPGTLGAFHQTLWGGPSRDSDLKQRELEPAIRECMAIVIMPSFVPNITIESRANWFGLTNPRKKSLTMHDAMRISRSYQSIVNSFNAVYDCGLYRPADVEQMKSFVYQLETRLPLQQKMAPVPHENNLGAYDLFDSGVTSLGPELTGWYGAPGVDPTSSTTIFLTGKRFSVLESRIVVGGRFAPFRLISRNVLEVTVPPGFQPLTDPRYSNFVDIHLATPYGPSSHLLVPINNRSQAGGGRFIWTTSTLVGTLHFKGTEAKFLTTTAPPTITLRTPTFGAPLTLPVAISIRNTDRLLVQATINAEFDVRSQSYVIGGTEFLNFATQINGAANKIFEVTKPAPGTRHVLSVFGTVAVPGARPEPILNPMTVDITLEELK